MNTIQQIRNIVAFNREQLGLGTTLKMILNGGYKFATRNEKTIERSFMRVQEDEQLVAKTERRVKDEFQVVSIGIAITFFIIGVAVGKFLI